MWKKKKQAMSGINSANNKLEGKMYEVRKHQTSTDFRALLSIFVHSCLSTSSNPLFSLKLCFRIAVSFPPEPVHQSLLTLGIRTEQRPTAAQSALAFSMTKIIFHSLLTKKKKKQQHFISWFIVKYYYCAVVYCKLALIFNYTLSYCIFKFY